MKKIIKSTLIFVCLFIGGFYLSAQPGNPGDGTDPDNPVPITGIEYLIAAGAAFGAKKLYDKKKK
jgi:hypothetical protein